MIKISAVGVTGQQVAGSVDKNPDSCPICHHAIVPIDLGICRMLNSSNTSLERIFQCPNAACLHLFVARYTQRRAESSLFGWHSSVPNEKIDMPHSEIITAISKDYCEIYNEAHEAEQDGLELVAGPGYRKALEFLVKDYLFTVHTGAAEKEKIQKMPLGNCIATYVKNERIAQTAARAAWLGNDETHYLRKWEGKDLDDLKRLIGLTVRWIEMEQMTDDAVKDMPEGKKSLRPD
jgi:hypothetical protein